ncbi:MAG: beta-glucosidase, partial [Calditrichaeota bacterium]|nr:beta-glucosidase [Calditrichota bacterium]
EMTSPPVYFGDSLLVAVQNGRVSDKVLDYKARRILRVMFTLGLFDGPERKGAVDTPEHRALSRKVAEQSVVLLKNRGHLLPLKSERIRTIAVLGPKAAQASLGGGGSSETTPTYSVSLLQALRERFHGRARVLCSKGVEFRYEMPAVPGKLLRTPDGRPGVLAEYYRGMFLRGSPVVTRIDSAINFDWGKGAPAPGVPPDRFSVRWRGKLLSPGSGRYRLGIYSNDGSKLFVNGKLFVNNWGNHHGLLKSAEIELTAGDTLDIEVVFYELGNTAIARLEMEPVHEDPIDPRAVELARQADVALVCVGLTKEHEAEGWDRDSMDLPGAQARLIREVARANPNTVVILTNGSPVTMIPWIHEVPAVIEAFYPGQEEGHVLADILFGDVNPSGKLPDTFPRRYEDNPAAPFYPSDNDELVYGEGIHVGYRHYDAKGIEPLFPFGFGLSYTKFAYRNLRLSTHSLSPDDTLWVSFEIRNTGPRAGDEIAQLYIRDREASLPREVKALKGFQRVHLEVGESKEVRLPVTARDLAFYDPTQHCWIAEAGEFDVLVGASSRDIRLKQTFSLRQSERLD